MDKVKKIIGYAILLAFGGGLIYVYADMVIKHGWWRGLILPLLLMATMVSIAALAIWLIYSSKNKKNG